MRLPHPIPYQGSKRLLAPAILQTVAGRRFRRLYEPFAGSAALTLATAQANLATAYVIADSLEPLTAVWQAILSSPEELATAYARLWEEGRRDFANHYTLIRDRFNRSAEPALLLYLLARCAKNAPRFNRSGDFNQAADRRRSGRRPAIMRRELLGATALLAGRTTVCRADVAETLSATTPEDLVYLDPPYEGTSTGRDHRYHQGFDRARLIALLDDLNRRCIPYLLSYDGRSGSKTYGAPLPDRLGLQRRELHAGRSAQATLSGHTAITVESLYLSPALLRG